MTQQAVGSERALASLHGRTVAYRELPGTGTPLLLIHGIGSNGDTWGRIPEELSARGLRVVVVDLPGHGESSRGRGDYSLGAMASSLRDLLDVLGIDRAHLVGHSLGGGVSMQFAYQFPERVDSMTLVSSGGLGEETFTGLRAATLPGAELVLKWTVNSKTMAGASWVGSQLDRLGIRPHALSPRALETVGWLADDERRSAFLATLRSVVGPRGQNVSALDKLHLMSGRRVLIIWGDRDPMIPMHHGENAASLIPGSRFVVFPGASHEPHIHDPERFTQLLIEHVSQD